MHNARLHLGTLETHQNETDSVPPNKAPGILLSETFILIYFLI